MILWLPVFFAALVLLVWALPFADPLRDNVNRFRDVFDGFVVLLALFLAATQCLLLGYNLGWVSTVTVAILVLVGVLLIATGYILYVSEPNWFIGFRTPWTLSSPVVWKRVNRVAGIFFALFGLLITVSSIFSTMLALYEIFALLAVVILLAVWSYVLYVNEHR